MNSKERVLKAINFEEPDRTPVDFSCTEEYEEILYRHFNIKKRNIITNPLLNSVDPQILKKLNCDMITVAPNYTGPELEKGNDGSRRNLFGVIEKPFVKNGTTYYEYTGTPLKNATLEEVENYRWPSPDWFDYKTIKKQCEEADEFCLVSGSPGNVDFFHKAGRLIGVKELYTGLARKNPVLLKIFEKISDFFYEYNRRIFESGQGLIDIAFYGDDYGGVAGPLIGEKTYRKILKPFWEKHYQLAKSYELKVMHHSCGAISSLLPVMNETGVNIIDPLQTDTKDINLSELKSKFHGKIAFHGGICFEKHIASPIENIRKEVKQIVSIMGAGGGYIMSPTTIVTNEIPLNNVLTIFEKTFPWD